MLVKIETMVVIYRWLGMFIWYWERSKRHFLAAYCTWKYRRELDCGPSVHFTGPCRFYGGKRISIGENVTITENAFVKGEGGLKIGDNCHFSRNLTIYTHNHNFRGEALPYDHTFIFKPVVIEDNVWVGINVTILPGAFIGEGAIVGAGTIVAGRVEPGSIVGSSQLRLLGRRDHEHYTRLLSEGRFGGLNGQLYQSSMDRE